jgi:pimeloyl-ACP methyl ester carboxylesterase
VISSEELAARCGGDPEFRLAARPVPPRLYNDIAFAALLGGRVGGDELAYWHYYLVDHDLRDEAPAIETDRVAVHLLTGEYGASATIEHGQAVHEAVAGSTFTVMGGVGHFPMAENPDAFSGHVLPALEDIRKNRA